MSGFAGGGGPSWNSFMPSFNGLGELLKKQQAERDAKNKVSEPTEADPETRRKAEEARALERNAKGRASTLLTGGQGVLETPNSARRILLGA